MTQFTTEIVEALVKKQDITEVFRTHLETAVKNQKVMIYKKRLDCYLHKNIDSPFHCPTSII